jgi:hydrogenase maturation protease
MARQALDREDFELDYHSDTLVLGIGNLLWSDEGFGIRALERMHADWQFAPHTHLLDGGTQGLYLLPYVEGCRHLLILDAVDYGLPPGTLKVVENDDVPRFMGAKKMSLHQTGFQEVLSVALLRGWTPEHITLIGVQPETLEDYGGSLSDTVKAVVPEAVQIAVQRLCAWGANPQPRGNQLPDRERITLHTLDITRYETERPSASAACRLGDERFLPTP